jgi:hypothetical protein
MVMVIGVLLVLLAFALPLVIRPSDLPPPEPTSPTQHLEDRKAAIYENLRDLQGEYRMGKLSDADYQQTKLDLQKELAGVLAEIERVESEPDSSASAAAVSPSA